MFRASHYNYFINSHSADEEALVFNKFYGSLHFLAPEKARNLKQGRINAFSVDEQHELFESGFLVDVEVNEQQQGFFRFEKQKEEDSLLLITLELTQQCNFACPYCYQNDDRKLGNIESSTIQHILQYAENVLSQNKARHITDIEIRFIGGEPLLLKDSLIFSIEQFHKLSQKYGVQLHTHIDTNGSLLCEAELVSLFDKISISLTDKEDHDMQRPMKNGDGTFDLILQNLVHLKEAFNTHETLLNIRFNANHRNGHHIRDLFARLQEIGIKNIDLELANTVNFNYNHSENGLSRQAFEGIYWDYIKMRFEHDMIIRDFPFPTFSLCKAYIPYNLKVTHDGRLGMCGAFRPSIGDIQQLSRDISLYDKLFQDYVSYNPYDDPECHQCQDIGICGGKLFCRNGTSLDYQVNPCDFLPYTLDNYLTFFCEKYSEKPELFEIPDTRV